MTPLIYSSIRGSVEVVKEILNMNKLTILEMTDKRGNTALHKACFNGHVEVVQLLLSHGASVYTKNIFLLTPIHFACTEGRAEIVKILLESDSSVSENVFTIKDYEENTPLHLATESGHLDVVQLILQRSQNDILRKIDIQRANGETALHIAATFGFVDIFRILLKAESDVNKKNRKSETPLFTAASNGKTEIIKALFENSMDVTTEQTDWRGNTALHVACFNGHVDTVNYLLNIMSHDVIQSHNSKEETCLKLAVKGRQFKIVQVLLNSSSKEVLLHGSDRKFNTPLHAACKRGFIEIAQALIENGAKLNPRNESDRTPLHIAAMFGHMDVIMLLMASHELGEDNKRSYINAEDEYSETPLHMAASNGHYKCVSELLKHGANINNINGNLWTPLESAANAGHATSLEVMLDHGMFSNRKSISGETSLHLACKKGFSPCVELLLEVYTDITDKLPDGRNCLDLCIDNGHEDCTLKLLEHKSWKELLKNAILDSDGELRTPMRKLVKKMPNVAKLIFDRCISYNHQNIDSDDFEFTMTFDLVDDMYSINQWKRTAAMENEVYYENNTSSALDLDAIELKVQGGSERMYNTMKSEEVIVKKPLIYEDDGKLSKNATPYSKSANELKDNNLLTIMVELKREDLLKHPLIESLIAMKWNKYGRFLFIFYMIFYIIYLVSFNLYITILPPPFTVNRSLSESETNNGNKCIRVIPEAVDVWGSACLQLSDARFATIYLLYILSCFQLLIEIFQVFSIRIRYFLRPGNYLDLTLYVSTLLILYDSNTLDEMTGVRQEWQWELAAVTVFLSWINLLLYLQHVSFLGIYILMFINVVKTFLRFSIVVIFFLFAFAMSFYALWENQYAFRTPGMSIVKSFMMMVGEVDYNTLFLSYYTSTTYASKLFYNSVSYLMYVIFVLTMSVLVMNLLVGLAVGDIQAVQNEAELKRIGIQVDELLSTEVTAPSKISRYFFRREFKFRPNDCKRYPKFFRFLVERKNLRPRNVLEVLQR